MHCARPPLGPVQSDARLRRTRPTPHTFEKIIQEVASSRQTERGNREDDKRSESAMEDRKRQGYF